jgi:hypothetical protein
MKRMSARNGRRLWRPVFVLVKVPIPEISATAT